MDKQKSGKVFYIMYIVQVIWKYFKSFFFVLLFGTRNVIPRLEFKT